MPDSTGTPNPSKPQIVELGFERAHEVAAELKNSIKYDYEAATVYTGEHAEYGQIHLIIPPLGNPFVLPVVIQNLSV